MQVEGNCNTIKLDAAFVNVINEIKTNYEQQIQELKKQVKEYHNKYVEMHDKYEVLARRYFGRSSEKINNDANQPLLFAGEAEPELEPYPF